MKVKTPKAVEIPLECCDECKHEKPAYGFTSVGSVETGYRSLCATCCNGEYMRRAGLPELSTSEFPPITLPDSLGNSHTFHFAVRMTTGLGIQAFEWIDERPGGYKFGVLEQPATPVHDAYDRLIAKIKRGLTQRYLESSDFPSGGNRLYIKGSAITGRIEEDDLSKPIAVIDGTEYSWEELGRFVSSHMGFNFRLECFDPYDEVDVEADPERPDPIWWLEREKQSREERKFQ